MVGRTWTASAQDHPDSGGQVGSTVVVKVLLVVVVFLLVTLGLVLMQPRPDPGAVVVSVDVQPEALPVVEPGIVATPPPEPATSQEIVPETEVTRAAASLLELRQQLASRETSHLLRRPVAGLAPDARHLDLPRLVTDVLTGFGYEVVPNDRLHVLLVQALADQKSDAYIDALLNTALARDEFEPPARLQTINGRLNTPMLLDALVRRASG